MSILNSLLWCLGINPSHYVISPVAKKAEPPKKKGKQATKWDLNGTNKDIVNLDFSDANGAAEAAINAQNEMPSQEEVGF